MILVVAALGLSYPIVIQANERLKLNFLKII